MPMERCIALDRDGEGRGGIRGSLRVVVTGVFVVNNRILLGI